MSGGHYDYFYMKVIDMTERLEEDLENDESTISEDDKRDISEETKELMRQLRAELLHTARKTKVLEYYLSGDYAEEDFKKVMAEPFNPRIDRESIWKV